MMTLNPLEINRELSLSEAALELLRDNLNLKRDEFIHFLCHRSRYLQFLGQFKIDHLLANKTIFAFFHTSFINEFSFLELVANERVEFLGDSVLGLYVSEKVYLKYPQMKEGDMSRLKSSLVNEDSLFELSKMLNFDMFIILGRGEHKRNGQLRPSILSDAFEAFLGVLYIELGRDGVFSFLDQVIESYESQFQQCFFSRSRLETFDSKTKLQEKTMALYREHPVYLSKQLEDSSFDIEVLIKGKMILSMNHISKKKGEKILAGKILEKQLYIIN